MASTESASATPAEAPRVSPLRAAFREYRWVAEIGIGVAIYFAASAYQGRHLVGSGKEAPAFALTALDGQSVSLGSLRGKRVLLHFWATWCGVCRQEFGALNAVNAGLGKDEALVTVVADSDDPEAVRRFVADHGLKYPILLASDDVLRTYRVSAYPTNYFIAPDGVVKDHTVGMSTRISLNTRLALAR